MPEQRPPRQPPPIPGDGPAPHAGPGAAASNKKKSYLAVKLAIFGLLAATGLGIFAWNLRAERESYRESYIEARTARQICEEDLGNTRVQSAKLGGEAARVSAEKDHEKAARESAEKGLSETASSLQATQAELEELRRQRLEIEKRLAAFKALTAKFQKMIDTGRLEVVVRDGRMIVKLPAGVLFDSGKAELSRDGELALMEVAVVLRDLADRKLMVVGHTDSYPLKSADYADNRELSTARALNVTRFLVTAGIKPENLVSAGYGEHDPVQNNKTEAGRKANRRIEIVVLPNLDELGPLPPEMTAPAPDAPK